MASEKAQTLANVLRRINEGNDAARVEAREFLASVNPEELSSVERELASEGVTHGELKSLCSVHLEMMGGEFKDFRKGLEKGSVLHTFVCEHDRILDFLDELERVNVVIQKSNGFENVGNELSVLRYVAEHLVEAEPHHKREEDVLFPELEARGVFGPPQVMRMEHEELRPLKSGLLELAKNVDENNFPSFKKNFDLTAGSLLMLLREHILKENNILYPTAFQVIKEKKVWLEMKKACDKIGYCCFTPET